jgi:beta-barrel assembly-enhancing protease
MLVSLTTWTRRAAVTTLVAGGAALGTGCAISPQQEAEMGAQYAAEINRQLPIVQDAAVHRYLNVLGNQIAQHVQRPFNYRFYLVNSGQINAFAVPGGHIYINRGLIERTRNLSELAGVLAHEIAHVEERHSAQMIERMQRAELGLTAAYILTGRAPGGLEQAGVNILGNLWMAQHSREAEREADATAVPLLVRAGIDPRGLPSFFEVLLQEQQRSPGRVEQWFSTHPLTAERTAETQRMIQQVPAAQLQGLTTNTPQYEDFKARVARLPAPPAQFR